MRFRAIYNALKHAILPWWMYEQSCHYDCGYWHHMWINIIYALRWLTFQEDQSDIEFETQHNNHEN